MKQLTDQIFDLCVVGSSPAGIISALEYAKLNPDKKVALIEFGIPGMVENSLDESIKITKTLNHHPVYECTNKGLGGTSLTWGGRCVMYDEVDFIDRPIVQGGCTWDVDIFHDVNAYLDKTAGYFECGEPIFDLKQSTQFKNTGIAEGFKSDDITDTVVERWSMPTRFGARYRADLEALSNLTLFEGFEARHFSELDPNGNAAWLMIINANGDKGQLQAKKFVIAAGTQETTRLLLRNKQLFNRLGFVPKSLGKFYQSHLSGKIASVKFYGNPKKTDFGFLRDENGIYLRRRFQFSTDYLVKNNLLNTAIWLDNPLYHDPKHKSGAMSLMYMAMITPILGKKLAPPAIAASITKGKVENLGAHFLNILKGLPGSITKPASIFYKRYCLKRKLPGVFLYSPENKYALHFHSEQVPLEMNNMTLGQDGETLIIDYSLSDPDIQSVIDLHKKLDQDLRASNSGELVYWFPENELKDAINKMSRDGIHQSGTTRIADSPEEGTVDRNLKVFGTSNVYVCSSSVFPTSGQANPTFYLGAFAVRLANYLSKI